MANTKVFRHWLGCAYEILNSKKFRINKINYSFILTILYMYVEDNIIHYKIRL